MKFKTFKFEFVIRGISPDEANLLWELIRQECEERSAPLISGGYHEVSIKPEAKSNEQEA